MSINRTNRQIGSILVGLTLLIALAVVSLAYSHGYFFNSSGTENLQSYTSTQVSIPSTTQQMYEVNAWVVDTPLTRSQGLSVVDAMDNNQGMLFIFEEDSNHPFWMKDMAFPIDIIWLNSDKEVVSIKESAHPEDYPEVYYPDSYARYVLELNAGMVALHGIEEGDMFQW
jgi:uncharacterized membrane protein (UPF0127 family)